MIQPDPQKLVAGITKVASLPEIYMKVETALNNPKSSSKFLADIVSEDTALTARLLRLANSSYFNFPSKVDTVTQAITVIGTRQLRDIVLASSIVSVFKDITSDLIDMNMFWRHSVACGVACRIISTVRRETNVETAFVSGLLHDIGRLILYKDKADVMGQLLSQCKESDTLLYVAEKELLGFDHALLGGLLLKEWKLPTRLIETTSFHHAPHRAKEYVVETATVHVGDILANALQFGSSGERFAPPVSKSAWEVLGLEDGSMSMVADELDKQYAVAVEFVLGV